MKKHIIKNSLNLYKKAEKIIPGKTQLISRRSSQFAHGINPIYAKESKGGYFVDVDDNRYLDWMNAVSAIILGHSHDHVDNAVKEQIDNGSVVFFEGGSKVRDSHGHDGGSMYDIKDYLNYKVLTGNVKYSASAIYNTDKYDLDFS